MKLYYEQRFGMARAAVFRDGQALIYSQGWIDDNRLDLLGVRSVARLISLRDTIGFVKLGDGTEAIIERPQSIGLNEGCMLEIVILAEARGDKLARAKVLTLCEGPPRRLSPTLDLKVKIINQAQNLIDPNCRIEIVTSHQADVFEVNQALEIAYTEAVTPSFGLKGGGYLSIEPTRALVACDVDLGNAPTSMTKSTKPLKAQTNALALTEVARRLRLSNLGGLVVVDLIGSRHDSDALTQGLRAAFGAEAKEIIVGPITRFGTYEFTRPWGATPHKDQVSWPLSKAQHLLWAAVTEAQSDAGSLISIRAPSKILETVQKAIALSHDPLGPRLRLEADERLVPLVRRI